MLRIIVVLLTLMTNVLAQDMEPKCIELLKPKITPCCTLNVKHTPEYVMDCLKLTNEPGKCEHDICLATKAGIAIIDGNIDFKAAQVKIEETLEAFPEILEAVKKNCFDTEVSSNTCAFQKLVQCTKFVVLENCPTLSNDSECKNVKSLANDCAKYFH